MSTPAAHYASWPELQRARRAIVVVDVVESVRLMQADEAGVIDRWRRFVHEVRTAVLPKHGGRLVKSLGDGMLLEFEGVPEAVAAALELQERIAPVSSARPIGEVIALRVGINEATVVRDELDVYGAGVNLAARLAAMAGPGQIVISEAVRHAIVPGLDGSIEDLGECYLKHIELPERLFRVRAAHECNGSVQLGSSDLLPSIAFLPVDIGRADGDLEPLGRTLAHELTAAAARSALWRVTSALSTSSLVARALPIGSVGAVLGADYVTSGVLRRDAGGLELVLEVHESRSSCMVFSTHRSTTLAEVFSMDGRFAPALIEEIARALIARQIQVGHAMAVPTLPAYALLLYGVALLHRLSRRHAARAHDVLEHLVDRHPRSPDARVWLAKWHFLQLAQAWSSDQRRDTEMTRSLLARSLEHSPEHPMSLALEGHVCAFVDGDVAKAEQHLRHAVQAGANEPLAWLFLSNVLTSTGRGAEAVAAVERARALSPLDPLSYYYDLFAAGAYSAAGRHDEALVFAQRSVAHNALHLSSLVQLIIEQVFTGHVDEARQGVERYLALRPDASVGRFLAGHTAKGCALAQREADALLEAGMPA